MHSIEPRVGVQAVNMLQKVAILLVIVVAAGQLSYDAIASEDEALKEFKSELETISPASTLGQLLNDDVYIERFIEGHDLPTVTVIYRRLSNVLPFLSQRQAEELTAEMSARSTSIEKFELRYCALRNSVIPSENEAFSELYAQAPEETTDVIEEGLSAAFSVEEAETILDYLSRCRGF